MPKILSTLVLALVLGVATTPAQAQKSQRLVFASAGFEDSNRFWMVARPDHLQYDPFLETLLEVDPKTGEYTARLAEKWQHSPDFKEWTFFLRKGVQFGWRASTGARPGPASIATSAASRASRSCSSAWTITGRA